MISALAKTGTNQMTFMEMMIQKMMLKAKKILMMGDLNKLTILK